LLDRRVAAAPRLDARDTAERLRLPGFVGAALRVAGRLAARDFDAGFVRRFAFTPPLDFARFEICFFTAG
jgi:hypothetical protein